jgi:hypothetical protein
MALRFIILYIPFFLALLFESVPDVSYFLAWTGSFFIIWVSLSPILDVNNYSGNIFENPMRPILLTHFIFAGYMALTSIFFYMQNNGYYYLEKDEYALIEEKSIALIAQCQRYYCLGHAAFVTGIFLTMNYNFKPKYTIQIANISTFTLQLSYFFSGLTLVIRFLPGLDQVAIIFSGISVVSSVIALAYAIPEKKPAQIAISGFLFVSNEINALTSGWKEAVIVPIIMLGTYLYPNYKRTVLTLIPLVFGFYFYFIPTYNSIVRGLSWGGSMDGTSAALMAVEAIRSGEEDIQSNNWSFLTTRLSEIGMFIRFVEGIDGVSKPFYGFTIFEQALKSIIPRVLYPEKPVTENLVMERVYNAGVIEMGSRVSAKPPPVVDGYLSGGALGVFLTCIFLGAFASWASCRAEYLFGSYLFGSGLVYTGLFQILWRGNCFEFMANNMFWSAVMMHVIFFMGRRLNIIKEI